MELHIRLKTIFLTPLLFAAESEATEEPVSTEAPMAKEPVVRPISREALKEAGRLKVVPAPVDGAPYRIELRGFGGEDPFFHNAQATTNQSGYTGRPIDDPRYYWPLIELVEGLRDWSVSAYDVTKHAAAATYEAATDAAETTYDATKHAAEATYDATTYVAGEAVDVTKSVAHHTYDASAAVAGGAVEATKSVAHASER